MTNTLMQKYGEVTANKIKNPRELWQIEALQSYEGLANTIRQAYGSKKPTIKFECHVLQTLLFFFDGNLHPY